MTDTVYEFLKSSHVWAGFVALAMFWIPLITQNASKLHRRSGWLYTIAMAVVSVSALVMALIRISGLKESNQEQLELAWFLLVIAWLSASAGWHGLVVLQARWWRRSPQLLNGITICFAGVLGLGGVGVIIYGWMHQNMLLAWFPLVAVNLSVMQMLMLVRRRKDHPKVWRMREHIIGMVGCGISTITAFTVFAFPRLLGWESAPLWMWLLPIIVLNPVILFAIRKHARAS